MRGRKEEAGWWEEGVLPSKGLRDGSLQMTVVSQLGQDCRDKAHATAIVLLSSLSGLFEGSNEQYPGHSLVQRQGWEAAQLPYEIPELHLRAASSVSFMCVRVCMCVLVVVVVVCGRINLRPGIWATSILFLWWSSRQEKPGQEVLGWSVLRFVCCERLFWAILGDTIWKVLDGQNCESHFIVIMVMNYWIIEFPAVTGTALYLSTVSALSHLILTVILLGRYYHLHLTEEQTSLEG